MAECHPDRKHYAKGKCHSCYVRQWTLAHPEADTGNTWLRNRPDRQRALNRKYHLRDQYGITPEQYAAMYEEQDGRCANLRCRAWYPLEVNDLRLALHVDHNHATGEIRKLLCRSCNVALGQVGESTERLLGLIEYLEN